MVFIKGDVSKRQEPEVAKDGDLVLRAKAFAGLRAAVLAWKPASDAAVSAPTPPFALLSSLRGRSHAL